MDYRSIQKPPIYKYEVRSNVAVRSAAQRVIAPQKFKIPANPVQKIDKPVKHKPQIVNRLPKIRLSPKHNIVIAKTLAKPPYIDNKIKMLKDRGIGKILVIIANGPSVKEIDLEKLKNVIDNSKNIDTLSINNPHNGLWPTTYWMFADTTQYNRYTKEFNEYNKGLIINTNAIRKMKNNQINIKYRGGKGFARNIEDGFYLGRSTTFAAMQVALYMNYDKIFILGIDMTSINGKMHYYGKNPDVSDDARQKRFQLEAMFYQHAAENVMTAQERIKFYICSQYNPHEFVNYFNRLSTDRVIDELAKYTESI